MQQRGLCQLHPVWPNRQKGRPGYPRRRATRKSRGYIYTYLSIYLSIAFSIYLVVLLVRRTAPPHVKDQHENQKVSLSLYWQFPS